MIHKIADTVRAAPERFKTFFNTRSLREKTMILAMVACVFLAVDYFFLIAPALDTFNRLRPQAVSLGEAEAGLLDDARNAALIGKKWATTQSRLDEQEKQFIASNEIPALLENLSRLAMDSEVKLISVKPLEETAPEKWGPYGKIPIRLAAVAGTHELGRFLARLESGPVFFRVVQLQIQAGPTEIRRHRVEMDIEAVRRP